MMDLLEATPELEQQQQQHPAATPPHDSARQPQQQDLFWTPTKTLNDVEERKSLLIAEENGNGHNHPPTKGSVFRNRSNRNVGGSNKKSKKHSSKRHASDARDGSNNNNDKKDSVMCWCLPKQQQCQNYACCDPTVVRSTLYIMNVLSKVLVWASMVALCFAVVWYSIELKKHGKDAHLIAWFSAGAFVLLGFPISMYGIVSHLANYNQPAVQAYVVRILWMVPVYSIQSWLSLRFHRHAIYIETFRDSYESYVLYSFLQYLIQVLGGEEALILMLKDKSPTRGVHMWGLQYCVKPWLMGQPLRRIVDTKDDNENDEDHPLAHRTLSATTSSSTMNNNNNAGSAPRLHRVHWTSPFFVYCKFGVLQYVLLKFVCSILVVLLEKYDIYHEGDFTPRGGYLYICIVTNLSQCWALYCLIFFYYATKNELAPIRPVGKFLSVKALVFFTWWQSVCISILYQMDLIPHYYSGGFMSDATPPTLAPAPDYDITHGMFSQADSLLLDQQGGLALGGESSNLSSSSASSASTEWTSEDVAKGIQDYLICIEMFVAALVHLAVFSHEEYTVQAVEARQRSAPSSSYFADSKKRLGRKKGRRRYGNEWDAKSGTTATSFYSNEGQQQQQQHEEDLLLLQHPMDRMQDALQRQKEQQQQQQDLLLSGDIELGSSPVPSRLEQDANGSSSSSSSFVEEELSVTLHESSAGLSTTSSSNVELTPIANKSKPNFIRALLDSTIPQDLRDNTVGIIKGDYIVEKKTLLHHAATSDAYDLFARRRQQQQQQRSVLSSSPSKQSVVDENNDKQEASGDQTKGNSND